jgi:hypothetical protein
MVNVNKVGGVWLIRLITLMVNVNTEVKWDDTHEKVWFDYDRERTDEKM